MSCESINWFSYGVNIYIESEIHLRNNFRKMKSFMQVIYFHCYQILIVINKSFQMSGNLVFTNISSLVGIKTHR